MKPSKLIPSAVPASRLTRLARMGSLASGVAGAMLAEGVRQFSQGRRPRMDELLLTPANARRVVEELAQLRGAAMKVGQLLSMDTGDLLPPELSEILARLRSDARPMPMSQLVDVLNATWGTGWEHRFQGFSFTPLAAASIGQVHLAQTNDGRQLAIKVQYPGVRQSIASDVDNVATLLRMSGLLPRALDIAPLIEDAKRQLQNEADYILEGTYLTRYRALLGPGTEFVLPEVDDELTTTNILAMSYVEGVPVESLVAAPQAERDRVLSLLFALLFREIFDFHLIQTDPNFANYRYDIANGRLVLLDFGATRVYGEATVAAYRRLLTAGMQEDVVAANAAAIDIGYFRSDILEQHRRLVLEIFLLACEPLRYRGAYDFGSSDLAVRVRDLGLRLGTERDFWHTPPADALFLHRKVGGLYLLAAKLRARVDIVKLFTPYALT